MTAATTARVGKRTESPNRLNHGRGGVEARGAEEELPELRGMTSSRASGSEGLKTRVRAWPRALAGSGVRPGAAPGCGCGSSTVHWGTIPASSSQGASPPVPLKHGSAGPTPRGAHQETFPIPSRPKQTAPSRTGLAPSSLSSPSTSSQGQAPAPQPLPTR